MSDERIYENLSLYRKGEALAAKREGGHITGEYKIEQDAVDKDGTRTIVLKPVDKTEFLKRVKELAGLLAEKMGEPKTGMFAKLVEDALIDVKDEDVERMLKRVGEGEKVSRAHCFRLYVGDGRKKNCDLLELRS